MVSSQSSQLDSGLSEMRHEVDECRSEAARVKLEAAHLSAALRDAEAAKRSKDKQIANLQQYVFITNIHITCTHLLFILNTVVFPISDLTAFVAHRIRSSLNNTWHVEHIRGVIL